MNKKALISFVLAIALMITGLVTAPVVNAVDTDAVTKKMDAYVKFLDGYGKAYWNAGLRSSSSTANFKTHIKDGDLSYGLTTSACTRKDSSKSHIHANGCTSNIFGGAAQCFGFAKYFSYYLFGSYPSAASGSSVTAGYKNDKKWTYYSKSAGKNCPELKPGDFIRYYGAKTHAAVVYSVDSKKDSITVIQANSGGIGYCGITKAKLSLSYSEFKNYYKNEKAYVCRYNGEVTDTVIESETAKNIPVESITLDIQDVCLDVGVTTTLKATVSPANATDAAVTWSSSNSAVVSVNQNGTITTRKVGSADITAKAGGKSVSVNIEVWDMSAQTPTPAPKESSLQFVSMKLPSGTHYLGESLTLDGTVKSNYQITDVQFNLLRDGSSGYVRFAYPNSEAFSLAGDLSRVAEEMTKAGTYEISITARDESGKKVSYTGKFTMQSGPIVDPTVQGEVYGTGGGLSIRKGPGTSYEKIGRITEGSTCTIYPNKSSGNWYYISYNGIEGYASKNYIKLKGTSSNTRIGTVYGTGAALSIRTGPDTSYEKIGRIPDGSTCTVYPDKSTANWYYVEYNGIKGYASKSYIKLK